MFHSDELKIKKEITKIKYKIVILILMPIIIVGGLFGYGYYKVNQLLQNESTSSDKLLQESISQSGKYSIKAYLHNGGATVDWAVNCDLIIDDKKTKRIYRDYHIKEANIIWINENTVSINNHIIDLPDGNYDWQKDNP